MKFSVTALLSGVTANALALALWMYMPWRWLVAWVVAGVFTILVISMAERFWPQGLHYLRRQRAMQLAAASLIGGVVGSAVGLLVVCGVSFLFAVTKSTLSFALAGGILRGGTCMGAALGLLFPRLYTLLLEIGKLLLLVP